MYAIRSYYAAAAQLHHLGDDGVVAIKPGTLKIDEPETFHRLLVDTIPEYQDVFLEDPYAKDSKVIELLKEATLHHINAALQ